MNVKLCDWCKKDITEKGEAIGSKLGTFVRDRLSNQGIRDICQECLAKYEKPISEGFERGMYALKGHVYLTKEEIDQRFNAVIIDAEQENTHYETFSGENCDDCSGWTVGEHRCDCGNRRVCWAYNQLDDGTIEVYPEAY